MSDSQQIRILMPGNNHIGYVDCFLLDGMAELQPYSLIGCIDQESSQHIPGIFLSPPIVPDRNLLDILGAPPHELKIEFECQETEKEADLSVMIRKRDKPETFLNVTFSTSYGNWDDFENLIARSEKCWLIWRGEGFEFFASFDILTTLVDRSAFELFQ